MPDAKASAQAVEDRQRRERERVRKRREQKVLAGLLSTENWLRNVEATVKAKGDEIREIRLGLEGEWN